MHISRLKFHIADFITDLESHSNLDDDDDDVSEEYYSRLLVLDEVIHDEVSDNFVNFLESTHTFRKFLKKRYEQRKKENLAGGYKI